MRTPSGQPGRAATAAQNGVPVASDPIHVAANESARHAETLAQSAWTNIRRAVLVISEIDEWGRERKGGREGGCRSYAAQDGSGFDVSSEYPIETLPRSRFPWAVVVVSLSLVMVAAAIYLVLGWQRMAATCLSEDAAPPEASPAGVVLSWSWTPPGFACTWESMDGGEPITERSLWWG